MRDLARIKMRREWEWRGKTCSRVLPFSDGSGGVLRSRPGDLVCGRGALRPKAGAGEGCAPKHAAFPDPGFF